ncbi:MAG: hypothetical protein H6602_01275 [Flavobacteriales bacterium]|nr:hypothetical protein [Flavobacteriales bacterium]
MTKKEFIKKQISRTNKKDYENYVTTRIIHKLDNLDVKFVTQQYIKRPSGKGFADLYFPQINYCVEIDEAHHLSQQEADKLRDRDFVSVVGREPRRIEVANSNMDEIHKQVDEVVDEIRDLIKAQGSAFVAWDIERDFDPKYWISRGFIDIKDDCSFRTMVDAANCFGKHYNKNGIWKGGVKHSREAGKLIWFPKLYQNADWNNSISVDENQIIEVCNNPAIVESHFNSVIDSNLYTRVVFARVAGTFGFVMYRYKGEYELDVKRSNIKSGLIWNRVATRTKTYPNPTPGKYG